MLLVEHVPVESKTKFHGNFWQMGIILFCKMGLNFFQCLAFGFRQDEG